MISLMYTSALFEAFPEAGRQVCHLRGVGDGLHTADGTHLPRLPVHQGQRTIERGVSFEITGHTHTLKYLI